jgi:hypothetical protein
MTEPQPSERGTTVESLPAATDEPTVPPEAAAVLAVAGVQALTTKLANRWTLAGTAVLGALGLAAVLVREWRGSLRTGR